MDNSKPSKNSSNAEWGSPERPFYKSNNNRWRTQSLFLEITQTNAYTPVFSMRPTDWKGYPSFKRLYIECNDPTEYSTALTLLGSWDHWLRLLEVPRIRAFIEECREALEVKLRSDGIRKLIEISKGNGPSARNAAQWLAEKGWTPSARGRPSRAEVARETRRQALVEKDINEDLARVRPSEDDTDPILN